MTTENASRPDPTPEHPPELITDWPAWSAAQMARLHPTPDGALLTSEQQTSLLAASRYLLRSAQSVEAEHGLALLSIIATQAHDLAAAVADATRLRERARLSETELLTVERAKRAAELFDMFSGNDLDAPESVLGNATKGLLDIIARLTTHDTAPDGETR